MPCWLDKWLKAEKLWRVGKGRGGGIEGCAELNGQGNKSWFYFLDALYFKLKLAFTKLIIEKLSEHFITTNN